MKLAQRKFLFCLILLLSNAGFAQTLKLGLEPVVPPGVYENELTPLFDSLSQDFQFQYIQSRTMAEYYQQAKTAQFNLSYATPPFMAVLSQYGFKPLLVSTKAIEVVLIGKPHINLADVEIKPNQSLYYVKNDPLAFYQSYVWDREFSTVAKPINSATQLMLSVLEEPNSLGVISSSDFDLLPKELRVKLKVLKRGEQGFLYLVAHESLSADHKKIKEYLLSFHNNFQGDEKYSYLNFFQFENITAKKQPNYQTYDEFLEVFRSQYDF